MAKGNGSSGRQLVIVESPAKARTIGRYLGRRFDVAASVGHVRDLPKKDLGVDVEGDFEPKYVTIRGKGKVLKELKDKARKADSVILATDPDREGEAIAYHVAEQLGWEKEPARFHRVEFREITKRAVERALEDPGELDLKKVEAQQARRILDRLVGYQVSPFLWKPIRPGLSAGRVQTVALRLICEREDEIRRFEPEEYWSITAHLGKEEEAFEARLQKIDGSSFTLPDEATTQAVLEAIDGVPFRATSVKRRERRKNAPAPFTTSTLQQEANRKLGFSASRTMQVAQKLYEGVDIDGETVGLITYMRTDSTVLSGEAIAGARRMIDREFGGDYLPASPRVYRTKAKNAQEAHEAIRPTDPFRTPERMARRLDQDMLRLYELVWKRTVASQMASAVVDRVAVDLNGEDGRATFRANGSVIRFDGFLKLYREDIDDRNADNRGEDDDNGDRRLPDMQEGEPSTLDRVEPEQHFTQPPPRYTEASLVKKMEELGIGRPSTYASILKVLQDRDYVTLDRRRFVPRDRGRLVTSFLASFFDRYFEYGFTAALEEKLDDISGGRADWKQVLREFWDAFSRAVDEASRLTGADVRDALDRELGAHFFAVDDDGSTEAARRCPACGDGRLGLNFGKFGAFIACSNYPDCRYTRQIGEGQDEDADGNGIELSLPKVLGSHPETGEEVSLRKGPYGFYVQLGEQAPKEKGQKAPPKPKRASLIKGMSPADVDLKLALRLLALPRELGAHPETGEQIVAGVGRYGPFLKLGSNFVSLPEEEDVLSIGINRAVEVLAQQENSGKVRKTRMIGEHPKDGKPVTQGSGRFGPYVKHGGLYASIPKDVEPETVSLDEALRLLEAKAAKKGAATKGSAKKAASKKSAARKKASARKARARKSAPGTRAAE